MDRFLAGLIFICFGCHGAGAKTENIYCALGKSVTLRPPSDSATAITGVIWRHGENHAAEWVKGDSAVELYRNFKGRTDLDTNTGVMVIRDMSNEESGEYSVEINNMRLEDKYVVKAVRKPPTANVWPKPGPTVNERELECEWRVDEEAEPVTYWWNTNGSWVQREKKIVIANNEAAQRVETFACKLVNIAGEAESEPWPNPFFEQPGNPALGALAIIPIAVFVGLGVLAFRNWDTIKARLSSGSGAGNVEPGNGAPAGGAPGGGAPESGAPESGAPEEVPLKAKEAS